MSAWEPPRRPGRGAATLRYLERLADDGRVFDSYDQLWRWSVRDADAFWASVADFFDTRFVEPPRAVLSGAMPGARWFEGATLSYPEHALRRRGEGTAIVHATEAGIQSSLSWDELADLVGRAAAGLRVLGVGPGDRVSGYLPNGVEAVVAFLATASLGAIWASSPPEFGPRAVIDRLGQLEPVVLFAVSGYSYRGRTVDRAADLATIRAGLPSLAHVVEVPSPGPVVPGAITWGDVVSSPAAASFLPVEFDHPLYVLFSSGTTGLPKAIVHGHGGILLEHQKLLSLHHDLGADDRFFWFSTTGWMMWNLLVSGLLVGASIVLYDGDPQFPGPSALWQLAASAEITSVGVGATLLDAAAKGGLDLSGLDLTRVHTVGATGSPLSESASRWVTDQLGDDVMVASISGGTDVCSAFVAGMPLLRWRHGDIGCRCLGAAVEAWDDGQPVTGAPGQLVITEPLPTMPIELWGDDGSQLLSTYFDEYPGVWCHGDWIELDQEGSCRISGRSDATLNRGGVRIGTAEFYAIVESFPEVADSLVVHLDGGPGDAGELVLFVTLTKGSALDDDLRLALARALRTELSPRHVPDVLADLRALPRTHSGKKLEVPVKRLLQGAAVDEVVARDAISDPDALDDLAAWAARRSTGVSL